MRRVNIAMVKLHVGQRFMAHDMKRCLQVPKCQFLAGGMKFDKYLIV